MPSSRTINVDVELNGRQVYRDAAASSNIASNIDLFLYSSRAEVRVHPISPSQLPDGSTLGEVIIAACYDTGCDSHVAGSPLRIPVKYIIGRLTTTPSSASLSAIEGSAVPPAQPLALDFIENADVSWHPYESIDWLTVSKHVDPDQHSLQLEVSLLPPGTYTGEIPWLIRRQIRAALHGQGTGRHEPAHIAALGAADIAAISLLLGERLYFCGERPTVVDATAYGFLANLLAFPARTPLQQAVEANPNLVAFCQRIKERYWSERADSTDRAATDKKTA